MDKAKTQAKKKQNAKLDATKQRYKVKESTIELFYLGHYKGNKVKCEEEEKDSSGWIADHPLHPWATVECCFKDMSKGIKHEEDLIPTVDPTEMGEGNDKPV